MKGMSTYLIDGLILNKEDFKDYDIKYTIYTRGYGKLTAIAKGAKKITSKLNSHLEFFMLSKIMIANGKSVKRVAGAQITESYGSINSDIEKRVIALYFFECINLLIKNDFEDDYVFELLVSFLNFLNNNNTRQEDLLCLNKYLFDLLDHLGYRPQIKAQKQKGLIAQLNSLVSQISDKQVKSYDILAKLFD
jgi:DNA repair protein RecO (recombination protein O)